MEEGKNKTKIIYLNGMRKDGNNYQWSQLSHGTPGFTLHLHHSAIVNLLYDGSTNVYDH